MGYGQYSDRGFRAEKRQGRVYEYGPLAHLWAHQGADYGRHVKGRMFFEPDPGDHGRASTIYSYGHHFPIATRYRVGKKDIILFTTLSYSATTRGHKDYVQHATNHLTVFSVEEPRHVEGAQFYYETQVKDLVARVNNPKARTIKEEMELATSFANRGNEFARAFKQRWRIKKPRWTKAQLARAAELEQKEEERRAAKRAKLEEKRRIQAEEREAEIVRAIVAWRASPKNALPWNAHYSKHWTNADAKLVEERERDKIEIWREHGGNGWHLGGTYLRLRDAETVETSKGAEFPLAHGVKALPFIRRCRLRGEAWQRNGHAVHLGVYSLDRIDEHGNVTAGCHRVPFEEIERLAERLGL